VFLAVPSFVGANFESGSEKRRERDLEKKDKASKREKVSGKESERERLNDSQIVCGRKCVKEIE